MHVVTLALFSYVGTVVLLGHCHHFLNLTLGPRRLVVSSVTEFHGPQVHEELGARSPRLQFTAATRGNLKFDVSLWKKMRLPACLVEMW